MARSRNQYHFAVRRARKQSEILKAKKLLEASLSSAIKLLKEMRKVRSGIGGNSELPDQLDGAQGEVSIVQKFKEV